MACYRRRGARTGGTAWRGRRRRWRWARRTGRCPGAWPACARPRHRPRTRARILLLRDSGETPGPVAERVGLAADGVRLCAARYPGGGVEHALSDGARSGRPRETGDADRAFVVDLACQRPAGLGHSAELWTNDLLWAHVRKVAEAAGHPRLATQRRMRSGGVLRRMRGGAM